MNVPTRPRLLPTSIERAIPRSFERGESRSRFYNADERRFFRAIGLALAEIRRERGLGQKEVGARLGKGNNCISMLELGRSSPMVSTLLRVTRALRVPVADLIIRASLISGEFGLVDDLRVRVIDAIRDLPAEDLGRVAALIGNRMPPRR